MQLIWLNETFPKLISLIQRMDYDDDFIWFPLWHHFIYVFFWIPGEVAPISGISESWDVGISESYALLDQLNTSTKSRYQVGPRGEDQNFPIAKQHELQNPNWKWDNI